MHEKRITRREVIKKAAYITPAILTLAAMPAFAKNGSGQHQPEPPRYRKPRIWRKW
jgi:hypothetical protein